MGLAPSRTRTAAVAFGAWAMVMTLAGCASAPRPPVDLRVPGLSAKPVVRLAWIDNYPRAIATVAYIIEHDLDLPQVHASLRFYPTPETLAQALVSGGYDQSDAHEVSATVGALASGRQIILNESALVRRPWSQRIAVLAHELTHAVQSQLADGRRSTSEQWMREGFSEWVAVRVLERLEVTTLPRARFARLRHVRAAGPLPGLSSMATSDQWLNPRLRNRDALLYPYAFLAVDLLVQQHGTARVIDYFRLFAFTDDREWAFEAAFGQDIAAFERVLQARIRTPGRPRETARLRH